jgi:methionyl-tRNA formyltransferase
MLHGDDLTGASVFQLEEGLDTGPVYGTLTEPIKPSDTAGELLDRLAGAGAGLLVSVLDGIEAGTLEPVPQPHEGVTLAPKVNVEDAAVRWADPAFSVDRRIRACTPNPGAWTTFRGERVKLGPVAVVAGGPALPAGELLVERGRVLVGTATDPVALGEVRAAGKKPMAADAWARGVRPAAEERLG